LGSGFGQERTERKQQAELAKRRVHGIAERMPTATKN
jgi:hypothetical protein